MLDLREKENCRAALTLDAGPFDEVYQLAADMGGMGFIDSAECEIMFNSALINIYMTHMSSEMGVKRYFFSSSACVYRDMVKDEAELSETEAYPAMPHNEYGWEKLFSERLYLAFYRSHGMEVRIARYHNIFGPEGSWRDGREKVPAAICRKVAVAQDGGEIEIWGDGEQTRSFLYIDECLEGTIRLMRSDWTGPVNIGSDEMVSINRLADMVMAIAGKKLTKKHIEGPQGVRGRTSDNRLVRQRLGWKPSGSLEGGLRKTYTWIETQLQQEEVQKEVAL